MVNNVSSTWDMLSIIASEQGPYFSGPITQALTKTLQISLNYHPQLSGKGNRKKINYRGLNELLNMVATFMTFCLIFYRLLIFVGFFFFPQI